MKKWKEGTLVTPYSTNDNRIFRVVKEIFVTGDSWREWFLLENILGEQNENTQYRCVFSSQNFRKLSQKEFDKRNPSEFNTTFKEFKGEFPKGSYIKGLCQKYKRSIYKVVNYYPIPEKNIVGIQVTGVEFDGIKYPDNSKEFIHLDEFQLYQPTEEELKVIND